MTFITTNLYGDRCEVLYTDTDSLLMDIQTEDVYKDMADKIDMYDMSDYPKDNPLQGVVNIKVLGKMKDECAGTPIAEYVELRPKMYSIKKSENGEIRKAKRVLRSIW